MLPKQPKFASDQPASPALSRRRHQLIGMATQEAPEADLSARASVGAQPRLLPDLGPASDVEPEPDIPPSPGTAAPFTAQPSDRVYRQGRRRSVRWAAAIMGVAVLAGLSWLLYQTLRGGGENTGDVPYITADASPEKVRPQQEGGVQVPNQDIGVYNELNGTKQPAKPEVLLPQPEAPMTPPVATAPPPSADNPSASDTAAIPAVPAPGLDIEPAAGGSTQAAQAPAQVQSTDQAPVASSTAAPAPATPVQTASTTGAFRVQLAAVKTQDAAQAAWKKLTKAFPDVLAGMKLNVVKVDRADGALYRVQGGSFADRAAAEAACGRLKAQNQACLVVSP